MVEIIPAIMPRDFAELRLRCGQVVGAAPIVQIDVMDGRFVPGLSWPYTPGGMREFQAIAREEEEGLPSWEELDFEIDLMVREPERVLNDWMAAGARRLVVHVESTEKIPEIIRSVASHEVVGGDLKIGAVELGLALNIETPLELLEPHLSSVGFVQCMGIATIGAQGEPFDERVIAKLMRLRAQHPSVILSVDGGVHFDTASTLVEAGATRLVAGSAIFGADDPKEAIAELAHLG